ncbi:MAG: methylated-DNA--[protein]-cysteine S-methyltransferase [Candidatus Omnitrophica bacterium]|nr:methylated-DNA--[protein]-cysteine S-methyltransferase [Candidatus Omnitrophota bacterium]
MPDFKLDTPLGIFKVRTSSRGVASLDFPPLPAPRGGRAQSVETRSGTAGKIRRYFAGDPRAISGIRLDWSGYTAFEKKVLRACACIPFGRTLTYSELARRIGRPRAARAVGNALGRNRVPLFIPCHRVVRSDGNPGGFTAGPGWKARLLALEQSLTSSRKILYNPNIKKRSATWKLIASSASPKKK